MSNGWTPSGPWMASFRRALADAFDEPSLELLTIDYFSHEKSFAKISAPGFGKTFEYRVQELINDARMDDWLLDLVAAARERRPRNATIAKIAEDLGLTSAGPRLLNETSKSLEELIQENAKFIHPTAFRERLAELEGQVCWVDVPNGGGTGFLIGVDLVLTNQHVIERIEKNLVSPTSVRCRFDYRQALDGSVPGRKKTITVELHADWLQDSQPPSPADWQPTLHEADMKESDYAILRLAEPIGDLPVGGDTVDSDAKPRKWIDVTGSVPPVDVGNQIFLLQHPRGEPLQLTVGTVTAFNDSGTRVRYDANSRDGSSGSPCFDADLRLVALHHAHDSATPAKWNQGIPFSVIRQSWKLG